MSTELSSLTLAAMALAALLLLYRWQQNHPLIDLSDLITGDNGRVSSTKFCQTGAWVVSTWGFASLIQQGKMTEWYFLGYMTAWTSYAVARAYISKSESPKKET